MSIYSRSTVQIDPYLCVLNIIYITTVKEEFRSSSIKSLHRREDEVDGQLKHTQDFRPRECCSCPVCINQ